MNDGFEIRIKQRWSGFALDFEAQSEAGGVCALFGPSGSGKTSVIRAIAGLLKADEAFIRVGDRVLTDTARGVLVKPHERRVGYVFQDARLFPHLNVLQNLEYGARGGRPANWDAVLDVLGIGALLERSPRDLSGGEAQRVAIGRALMSAPDILLLDEPLSALDAPRRAEILPYLDRLREVSDVQAFYVSHAMDEVARLADTLVLMRGGRAMRAGPLGDILSDPRAMPEVGLREAGSVIDVTVVEVDAGDGLSTLRSSNSVLWLPNVDADAGAAMRVRIRAVDIILSKDRPDGLSALNCMAATITEMHFGAGPGVAVGLRAGSDRLLARITAKSARAMQLAEGAQVFAVIKSVSVAPSSVTKR
ncbi:MAG: molybdenum ABC transporter ATP-binding protein [Litoreibacter sp.]|nr:molybdenum ABC transporter ATP-binding protein [Litoreibacter sp.]MCY4336542.1 molybdenum ABC transporter ATP-binding protein [Litoreibacter sp.]